MEPRTRADVEADLALAATELRYHRGRRGDTTNFRERVNEQPGFLVFELNELIREWVNGPHIIATIGTPADDTTRYTFTGGPLDADCG